MNYYLLVYDRRAGRILGQPREYPAPDRERASRDRLEAMIERRGQPDVEVVLFAADSLDDLTKTHSRYFETHDEILAGIDAIKR